MQTIKISGPVIIKDNRVILIKDTKDNFWKFPGGKVEKNETPEQTCIREVKEELGLDVFALKHLITIKLQKDETTNLELFHYLANYSNEITTGENIIAWNWFHLQELPPDCAPNIKPVIKEYLK